MNDVAFGGARRSLLSRRRPPLAEVVYLQLKQDIFDYRLLPGDRFSEGQIAERLCVSRTPVREALQRLEKEGYLQVHFRSGWSVRPLDFKLFDNLYDLRIILEVASVRQLCEFQDVAVLEPLRAIWLGERGERPCVGSEVAELDEAFHASLVQATGNPEVVRCHQDVTERIRILRRLDFTQGDRIDATFDEHGKILDTLLHRRTERAVSLLKAHIDASKAEVRKISLHQLYLARKG